MFGQTIQSDEITEPGLLTELQPICVLSPINAPNFLSSALITLFFILTLISLPSFQSVHLVSMWHLSAKLVGFVPLEGLGFRPTGP